VDQNSLFNKDARIFAFDDSPFSRKDKFASIIGVIMRKDMYIESIVRKKIRVDGLDVTDTVLEILKEKGSGIKLVMTQGTTFGGFNVLNVRKIFEETKIPVVNVVDHEPDMLSIKMALKKYFDDWEERYSILIGSFNHFDSLFIQSIGIRPEMAYKFIKQMTVNGTLPEPLRIADLVAGIC
jgi:endonuclease V-like protein UPF0215 family